MKMKVRMRLMKKTGSERIRELTMLRKNLPDGHQKYFVYFHKPADVRQMIFMVWKYPEQNDDRWLYIPAIKLVKRIAADDSRSSFVGSDFTYEDVSGRDLTADTHTLLREDVLNGRTCYVVESVPKNKKSAGYQRKISWIDKEHFLPLKEEYYDQRGELFRLYTAEEISDEHGFPTAMKRMMLNVKSGHRTEVTVQEIRYDLGLSESIFSERYLRQPPMQWLR